MLKVQDAYKIACDYIPNKKLDLVKCMEYKSLFVFSFEPELKNPLERYVDGLVSVNKETGVPGDFKPFYISKEELDSGKEIKFHKED